MVVARVRFLLKTNGVPLLLVNVCFGNVIGGIGEDVSDVGVTTTVVIDFVEVAFGVVDTGVV